jgi:hypothetical protein
MRRSSQSPCESFVTQENIKFHAIAEGRAEAAKCRQIVLKALLPRRQRMPAWRELDISDTNVSFHTRERAARRRRA